MQTDTLFVIVLMIVVSIVWGALAYPPLRKRLPKIYLIARSWWWMLAALCICYLIAKINLSGQHPYQWLLLTFFIIIGLRGAYEITRLWRSESKAQLIRKLQARGLQPHTIAIPHAKKLTINTQNDTQSTAQNDVLLYTYLNPLDMIFSFVFIVLIISLVFLQQLTWQRGQYGVLLFVLFASQFNDIAQYLCGKMFKGKLFKQGLAPRISPNKSIEGALFGSMLAALLAALLSIWLTPFGWWVSLLSAYSLAISGIAGDLLESAFKRQHGVKDTGTMLAGHGGVLDRVDSLLLGVPLFTLTYWLVG